MHVTNLNDQGKCILAFLALSVLAAWFGVYRVYKANMQQELQSRASRIAGFFVCFVVTVAAMAYTAFYILLLVYLSLDLDLE